MEKAKVQRIVGILIIMSLIIITLPLLIGKNDIPTQSHSVNAPSFVEQNKPSTTQDLASSEATIADKTALANNPESIPVAPTAPATTPANNPNIAETANNDVGKDLSDGWIVRLGIFRNAKNVDNLTKKLSNAGYKPILVNTTLPSGMVGTAVVVGPFADRVAARKLSTEIKKNLHLRGVIVNYSSAKK